MGVMRASRPYLLRVRLHVNVYRIADGLMCANSGTRATTSVTILRSSTEKFSGWTLATVKLRSLLLTHFVGSGWALPQCCRSWSFSVMLSQCTFRADGVNRPSKHRSVG